MIRRTAFLSGLILAMATARLRAAPGDFIDFAPLAGTMTGSIRCDNLKQPYFIYLDWRKKWDEHFVYANMCFEVWQQAGNKPGELVATGECVAGRLVGGADNGGYSFQGREFSNGTPTTQAQGILARTGPRAYRLNASSGPPFNARIKATLRLTHAFEETNSADAADVCRKIHMNPLQGNPREPVDYRVLRFSATAAFLGLQTNCSGVLVKTVLLYTPDSTRNDGIYDPDHPENVRERKE